VAVEGQVSGGLPPSGSVRACASTCRTALPGGRSGRGCGDSGPETITLLRLGVPHRGCCATVSDSPAAMVVGSYAVAPRSTILLLLLQHVSAGRVLRSAYRDAPTSSSVASCARLETPSLA
jgi:hypothetical protein